METVERYYTVLKYVDFLVSDVLAGWCYTLWVRPFLGSRRAAYLTGAAYASVMFFLFFGPFYIPTMLAYAIGTAAGFAVMALDERKYIGQKLYLAVVFYSVRWQMWRIVSNFFVNGVSRLQRYFLKNASSMAWFKTDAALRILWDMTALCLMYLGFCLMHKAYGRSARFIRSSARARGKTWRSLPTAAFCRTWRRRSFTGSFRAWSA